MTAQRFAALLVIIATLILLSSAGFAADAATTAGSVILLQNGQAPVPRIYVDADSAGSGSGVDWENAFQSLADGLAAATTSSHEVWVAGGTYDGPLTIPVGVAVYGGFAGTEVDLSERILGVHETIVVGAVTFEPGGWTRNPANGHFYRLTDSMTWTDAEAAAVSLGGHLVTINDAAENAWVASVFLWYDYCWIGFSDAAEEGTWQWASGQTPTYTNWDSGQPDNNWEEDYAEMWSGGMWNDWTADAQLPGLVEHDGDSSTVVSALDGLTIQESSSWGIECVDVSPEVRNCTIRNNPQGGVYCYNGSSTFTDCVIELNGSYGLRADDRAVVSVTDCTISGNSNYGVYADYYSDITINRCMITANGGGVSSYATSDLVISSSYVSGNYWGGIFCNNSSPEIINCIISGNGGSNYYYYYYYYGVDAPGIHCYYASPIITNCTISGNSASGVQCNSSSAPVVTNTILDDNGHYGIDRQSASAAPVVRYGLFSDNAGGDYSDVGTVYYGANDINMNVAGASNNFSGSPMYVMGATGTWTSDPTYDPATNRTTLTDSAASFVAGSLVGRLVNPATSQWMQALIVANTDITLVVIGDFTSVVSAGDPYQILDYHLSDGSSALDKADEASAPSQDFDGDPRPGDDGLVDLGADEAASSFVPGPDAQPPVSTVTAMAAAQTTASFAVRYLASDAESGVQYVRLFYRRSGGAWTQYGGDYTSSPIDFDTSATGGDGRYDFYTVATDNSDNAETAPPEPDATTLVMTSFAGPRLYVGPEGTGSELGSGWEDPIWDLQAAAVVAGAFSVPEVWVMEGTHGPVVVPVGVALYGGFAGTETDPAQRDLSTHQSTIEGGVVFEPHDDHSDTIEGATPIGFGYITGVLETLDDVDCFSFSATAGSTYYLYNHNYLHIELCLPDGTVDSSWDDWYMSAVCTVSGTYYLKVSGSDVGPYTLELGGDGGEGEGEGEGETDGQAAVLDGFTVTGSPDYGLTCVYASPDVRNCIIEHNSEGGVYCEMASPTLADCRLSFNGSYGVNCYNSSSPIITNCTITTTDYGVRIYYYSSVVLTGSTIADNGIGVAGWNSSGVLSGNIISGNEGVGVQCEDYFSPSIDNCIISGNGSAWNYWYYYYSNEAAGIYCYYYSDPVITNCTISGNSGSGIACFYEAHPTAANTILEGNGAYGIEETSSYNSECDVENCLFMNNVQGDYYDMQTGAYVGANDINMYLPGAANNFSGDPSFIHGDVGEWTSAPVYDEATGMSTLTDTTASFVPGALVGQLVNPATSQLGQALIAANTATTLVVFSDVGSFVSAGDPYQIMDYHLLDASNALDKANPAYAPEVDIDGDARPGDDALFDIGADEADSAFLPAEDVLPPVSEVFNLPRGHTTPEFSVPYLASDAESGVLNVRLFYRRTGGDWTPYGDTYTSSPITFDTSTTGGDGRYDFYTVATDLWDNIEEAPPLPDATTLVVTSFSGTRMYVGTGGTDAELGAGWDSPYRDLTATLLFASAFAVPEVWVSGGAYDGSVLVPLGVTVYGGFAGTETDPAQRQADANATVITGGVTFEPQDDHGDTPATATPITSEYVTGVFETLDDVDCFSFSATAGQLYYAYNYHYLTMQLSRADGTVELTWDDWYMYWECPVSGTYYLTVSGSEVGPYEFEVWEGGAKGEGESGGEPPQMPEAVLDGVTITGSEGWGITCVYASPHMNNCIITGNESGGIYVYLGAPILTNCTIADNGASGVLCDYGSDADISGCSVSGHTYGIRVYNSGSASVTGCLIYDNNSYGIDADWYCVVDVTRCTLAGNGTGIRAYGAEAVVLSQSVVSGNLWANIYLEYCSPLVSNCIVSGAGGYYYYYYYYSEGIGIQCYSASPTIVNCTVSGNAGTGVLCNYGSSPVVTNTIIERNGGYGVYESYSNADPVVQYCLFEANTEADYFDNETGAHTGADAINLNVAGAANNIGGDPLYTMGAVGVWTTAPVYDEETRRTTLVDSSASFEPGSLAGRMMNPATSQWRQVLIESNTATAIVVVGDVTDSVAEGDTYQIIDYHLLNGSVCIDTGTDTGAPLMDLDDNPRPIDIIGLEPDATGTEFDIGAYEFPGGGSLIVTPSGGLVSEGSVGGPFAPSSIALLLQNMGDDPLVWTAEWAQSWLNVSSDGGTLAPGASITLEISLGPGANSLPSGTYHDKVVITDVAAAVAQTRHVLLHVRTDYFTEVFDADDNDLDYQTLTFTPNGSANFYAVSRTTATSFPTDPAGGTPLSLWGDDFAMVTLAGGMQVSFYGVSYISFYVGSNGYITFTDGDWNNWPTLDNHFSLPRISALFDDLNPSAGGTVSWRQLSNRVAVTFENIPRYWSTGSNSFQIELFFNGIIRITHLQIDDAGGLAGLSEGFGTPEDFYESDLSAYQTLPRYPATALLGSTIETGALPYTWCDYQLNLNAGDAANLLVRLTPLEGSGTWRLLGRRSELPTLTLYNWATPASTTGAPLELLIPAPGAGSLFFSVYYSELGQFVPRQFRLEIIGLNRYLSRTSVSSGGNVGSVTVQLSGLGFESGVRVELRDAEGATLLTAFPTSWDGVSMIVTLDLTDLLPQAANIVVVWPDGYEETLPNAFTIIGGIGPRLDARLVVPDQVRPDRTYTLWLEYENTGDTDMPAPLFVVSSPQNVPMRLFSTDPYQDASIQLLGLSPIAPVEVLPPRAANRIPVQFIAASLDDIEFNLARLTADDTPIDWGDIGSQVQPDLDPEVWDRLWPVLTAQLGDTSADYHALLLANASYLGTLERTVYSVRDLFSFEIRKALGMIPRGYLAAGLDAFCPAPGLSLSFARVFQGRLDQRLYLGLLGRGWTHTFDVYLVELDEDNVVLHDMTGLTRLFRRNTDGTWSSSLGDHGKLQNSGGVFILTEADKTLYRFRSDLKLDYIEDLNGNRISAGYDGEGRLITLSHTSGDQFQLTYDGSDRLISLTDHAGRVTTYVYDGEQLASVTAPGGITVAYQYAAETGGPVDHALLSIEYADGVTQYYEYDALGRLSREYIDGEAESVTYEYDSLGHVTVRDAAGAATTLSPDEYGRPGIMTDALGRAVSMTYGAGFTLSTVDNPAGGASQFEYDNLGNVVAMTDTLGNVTRMTYDYRFGAPSSLTDARGNVTTFAHDDAGNTTDITYPDGGSETFTYDSPGNVTESTSRHGDITLYTHNSRGQITRKDFPDGTHVEYTYDTAGRLTAATDSSGTTTLEYDARGFLSHVAYPSGHWFSFEYNDMGQRTRRVGDDGFELNYAYDAAGRLEFVTDGDGAQFVEYQYDSKGQLSAEFKGNGTYSTYAYDDAGQLISLINYAPGGSVQSQFQYTYDANGNRTSMTTLEGATHYEYDALGQLGAVVYPDGSWTTYEYDAAGNRLAVTDNGTATSYTTNNMNQYAQVGTATYTYDDNGNMTSRTDASGIATFEYDYEDRLTRIVSPTEGTWEYTYDAFANMKTVSQNGVATHYTYDPATLVDLATQYDDAGSLVARYVHGLGAVSRIDASGPAFYAFDGVGNTREVTDADASVVNSYDYDPFGVVLSRDVALSNPFEFEGRFGVVATAPGMTHMRARAYDASIGRFTSLDPHVLLGGFNRYTYCWNSPLKFVDPTGTQTADPQGYRRIAKRTFWTGVGLMVLGIAAILHGNVPLACLAVGLGGAAIFTGGAMESVTGFGEAIEGGDPEEIQKWVNINKAVLRMPTGPDLAPWVAQQVGEEVGKKICNTGDEPKQAADCIPTDPLDDETTDLIRPVDPNEKVGPAGTGELRSVGVTDQLEYIIYFENDPEAGATAPAQEVVVTDYLDTDLDWSTFQITEIGWGAYTVDVPVDTAAYSTRVAISDYRTDVDKDWWVDVAVAIDYGTGLVQWTFSTLDPNTDDLPEDVLAGFLPVNDDTRRGEGHVAFTIKPKSDAAPSTRINNQASISFDTNAPIVTNEVFNTITGDNRPPLLVNPGDRTTVEGATVRLELHAEDPDGNVLTYAGAGLPPGLTLGAGTGIVTGTLGYTTAGVYTAIVTASDGELTDAKTFTWTVSNTNRAPALTNPGNQTGVEGADVSLPVVATDADGDALAYSAEGLPPGLVINELTGVISGTLDYSSAGQHNVAVSASDGYLSDSKSFMWTVTETPRPPVVTNPGSQSSAEGASVSLPITATDPDGTPLTFSATGLPPGLSINPTTGVISGTLGYNAAGSYSVTVTASDGSLSDSETFGWTVTNTPRPPVVTNPGTQTDAEGDVVSLQVAATDPDGDTLTYNATSLPPGLTINTSTGVISGTLAFNAAGVHTVSVSASDASLSDSETFTWNVKNTNRPPVLTNPGNQTHAQGANVSLQIVATDPDGDNLTFNATGLPDGLRINTANGLITGALAASGNYNPTVSVSDGSLSDSESFTWTVHSGDLPPVLTNPGNQSSAEGATVSLQIVATDPDGDTLAYSATGLPGGLDINPSTGLISGVIGFEAAGNHNVTLTVSDGTLNDSETFQWAVTNTNRPPALTNPGNQTHPEGATVSLQVAATDLDGDTLIYTASNLPPSLDIDPATGLISGVVGTAAANDYVVTIIVTDGQQNSEAEFTWTITPAGDDDGGGGCFGGSIAKTGSTGFRGDTMLLAMTSLAFVIVAGKRKQLVEQEA